MLEPTIIEGPVAPVPTTMLYHVTLASGVVATGPECFAPDGLLAAGSTPEVVIADDGRVLQTAARPSEPID